MGNSYSFMPKDLGTRVGIKYDPKNPDDIIWEKDGTNILLPIISFAFFVSGVYTIIFWYKR